MQGILYEEQSAFRLPVRDLDPRRRAGAWMTGRACARTWKPLRPLLVYLLILSFGVRFIHFSLFGGTLLSLHFWLVDLVVLLVVGITAYRYTLANQMVSQYYWLYERTGAFSWRAK